MSRLVARKVSQYLDRGTPNANVPVSGPRHCSGHRRGIDLAAAEGLLVGNGWEA